MNNLVKRLRGQYQVGPDEDVLGTRDFSDFIPAISLEAADRIEELETVIKPLIKVLRGWEPDYDCPDQMGNWQEAMELLIKVVDLLED